MSEPAQDVRILSPDEISTHNTRQSCWIIVHGKVYDVTDFLDDHPGGSKIILKYGGRDATKEYDPIHPPDAITTNLPLSKHLGAIDPSSSTTYAEVETEEDKRRALLLASVPPLSSVLNLHDFEAVARRVLPPRAWAYYSSAADDEITHRENRGVYQRIWFRPQVLVDVEHVDFSTSILGMRTSMPIYITATALGKLGHPDGELNLTRGASKHNVIQMIPTLASCSFDSLVDGAIPGQTQFLQLYVNRDRKITERIVRHAEERGIKGLFITVDAPQLGRREKDMRMKFDDEEGANVQQGDGNIEKNQGAARAISSFIDPSLSWKDIPWFKSITNMPIILKGVQRWEDALRAYDAGCAGIVLSNHGGRQLDTAPAGIEVLVSVVRAFREKRGITFPLRDGRFQIFVDGGVRRATDVLKAIALGATAVGIGRPFLYAYSAYGAEGVDKALQILKDEFEMNMRLLGAPTLADVGPDTVDASNVHQHVVAVPSDRLYDANYESMQVAQLREEKPRL
ncbi:hypothetical protein M0805_008653 [Coniferiporia weirii]|nr:hypothetical protein M0805_008653 [Coniferiporia weirii]